MPRRLALRRATYVLALVAVLLAVTPVFARAFVVAGPSMAPTLLLHDRVFSAHAAYDLRLPGSDRVLLQISDPDRGDIVVYHDAPKNALAIKRVVGLPGDTVELRDNVVILNGRATRHTRLSTGDLDAVPLANDLGDVVATETVGEQTYRITYTPGRSDRATYGPVVVPPERYVVLGDNRDNSADSRYVGVVARSQIRGKVVIGG